MQKRKGARINKTNLKNEIKNYDQIPIKWAKIKD